MSLLHGNAVLSENAVHVTSIRSRVSYTCCIESRSLARYNSSFAGLLQSIPGNADWKGRDRSDWWARWQCQQKATSPQGPDLPAGKWKGNKSSIPAAGCPHWCWLWSFYSNSIYRPKDLLPTLKMSSSLMHIWRDEEINLPVEVFSAYLGALVGPCWG